MNFRYFSHKIGGFILAALMLTGVVFFSSTTAEAQTRVRRPVVVYRPYYRVYRPNRLYRPFGWYDNGWYNNSWYNPYSQYIFNNSEQAAQKGYEQGVKTGEEDGRKNKSFSFERSHYYKEAGFGNFGEVYRRYFARGYENGYREGAARASAKY